MRVTYEIVRQWNSNCITHLRIFPYGLYVETSCNSSVYGKQYLFSIVGDKWFGVVYFYCIYLINVCFVHQSDCI